MGIDRAELDSIPHNEGLTATFPAMLWRRKSLLILGLVGGLVLGSLIYAQTAPLFQTKAQVMVIKKSSLPLSGTDPLQHYYDDYLSSHLDLIKSPLIVEQAIRKCGLNQLATMADHNDHPGTIISGLTADRTTSSGATGNVINLSFRGRVAQDCPVILNAIIDTYKEFLTTKYENVSDDTLKQITQLVQVLRADLDKKESEYSHFRKSSPLVYWKGTEGTHALDDWLSQIQAKRMNLLIQKADLESRLASLETGLKQGQSHESLLALVKADPAKSNLKAFGASVDEQMFALQLQEKTLLGEFGPDHPDVRAVRQRIALTRNFFNTLTLEHTAAETKSGPDPIQQAIKTLKHEIQEATSSLQVLTQLFETEEKTARELSRFKEEDKRHREAIGRAQIQFDPIIKRLEEIRLIRNIGGMSAEVTAPAKDVEKIRPVALNLFAMAGIFGLMGGAGLVYLAEITDKRFHTPEEIRRRLGLAVVGHIPVLPTDSTPTEEAGTPSLLDPTLCTYHHAKGIEAEAFRSIRTALYFSTGGEVHKVIQITSPETREGKSTLSANLAISIAQSGKRVLLIDADLRRPKQNKLFGVNNEVGLSQVVAEKSEFKDAICPSGVDGLDLLPCGARPHNPAELLTSTRFKELVDTLQEQYDYVLIDSPPLLAVSDPCIIAARVHGVLLVLRVSKKNRAAAERAREILNTLGTTTIGVIVNCIDQRGQGQYGSQSYSSYGYQYTYGYSEDQSYFQSEAEAEAAAASADISDSADDIKTEVSKSRKRRARLTTSSAKSHRSWFRWWS